MESNTPIDAADVNELASFLACNQVADLHASQPVDCIVLCGSAILHCAETVFSALDARGGRLCETLVICGGIGHSTKFLYDAIARHSEYNKTVYKDCKNEHVPESHVLYDIFKRHFNGTTNVVRAGCACRVIVEDRSTNCGANAVETRRVLESHGISDPKSFIIVQDPTMSIRTVASFRRAYSDKQHVPKFRACPTFTPKVRIYGHEVAFDIAGVDSDGLWDIERFFDLILGEIPRLRDDAEGYGPKGKGFIAHVDIPDSVDEAWKRLSVVIRTERSRQSRN